MVRATRLIVGPLIRRLHQKFLEMEREVSLSEKERRMNARLHSKSALAQGSEPLISVALTVKNGLPHLRKTVEALQRQTWQRFELVVQDGVSTDGTLEYLRGLKTRFPLTLVSEPDTGLAMGYSRALRRCQGDLVTFTASDEFFDDDALEVMAGWHARYPEAVMLYGGSKMISGPNDKLESIYIPGDFEFLDYLRWRMCPNVAAALFNRKILKEDLWLDESLQTVPDFELVVRLGLKYGQHRILRMPEVVSTSRADSVSMSFRPQFYAQFARDKQTIIDRVLNGESRDVFLSYIRRDIIANIHLSRAKHALAINPRDPAVTYHLLSAGEFLPGMPALKELVYSLPEFLWDEEKGVPIHISNKQLAEGHTLFSLDLRHFQVEKLWAADGAKIRIAADGVYIETPPHAWHYAATLPIENGRVAEDASYKFLRILFRDVKGQPTMALYDPAGDRLAWEVNSGKLESKEAVLLPCVDTAFSRLMIRNGPNEGRSALCIQSVEVVSIPKQRV
jgi:glycosyltransferase